MEKESLIHKENESASLTQVSTYIHEMVELEKETTTLWNLFARFMDQIEALTNSKREVEQPKLWKINPVPEFHEYPINPEIIEREKFGAKFFCLIGGAILGFFGCLSVFLFLEEVLRIIDDSNDLAMVMAVLLAVVGAIIGLIIGSIWGRILGKKEAIEDKKKRDNEARERIEKIKADNLQREARNKAMLEQYQRDCEAAEAEYQAACQKAALLKEQGRIIFDQYMILDKKRKAAYEVGIIPPDYRNMKCVFSLDHTFRNGLADNMKDAILLYEDKVFKGTIVDIGKGVLKSLERLDASVRELSNTMSRINDSVGLMYQDAERLVERLVEQGKTAEQILDESKATRYAMDAVKRCQEMNTYGYFS